MTKKTEHEVLFLSRFNLKPGKRNSHEAELRLRRFGTRFIVDKSGFLGGNSVHYNYYNDIEEAYADYKSCLDMYEHCLEMSR